MSAPRRRRWMDMIRRTADVLGEPYARRGSSLDDASLWAAHERAAKSIEASRAHAERVAASVARQRALLDGTAARANLVAARAEGLAPAAARINESFERLGVVALNAGLEGARAAEPHGRALLLLSEEIRANVGRGSDAADQIQRVVDDLASESAEVRRHIERTRDEGNEIGQGAAQLQAAAGEATGALDDLAERLRKATGIDPEMAKVAALAGDHARGLLSALTTLSTAAEAAPLVSALRPVIAPLSRLLGEMDAHANERGEGPEDGSGS